MRIGIELDDVLCNFTPMLNKYINKNLEQINCSNPINLENYTSKNYAKIWKKSESEAVNIISNFLESVCAENFVPINGAKETLSKLKMRNFNWYTIYVLTSRTTNKNAWVEWIDYNFSEIFDGVIFLEEFYPYCTKKNKNKAGVCDLLKIKLLIDDDPRNFDACSKLWDFTFVFYERVCNKNITSTISEHRGVPFFDKWKKLNIKAIEKKYSESIDNGFKFFRRSSLGNKIIIGIAGINSRVRMMAANIICEINDQFEKVSFGYRLDETICALTNTDYDADQNSIPSGFSNTLSQLKIMVNNSLKNSLGQDLWVKVMWDIPDFPIFAVITDVKYLIEVESVIERNGIILKIGNLESNAELNEWEFDYDVDIDISMNNADRLRKKLHEILMPYLYEKLCI